MCIRDSSRTVHAPSTDKTIGMTHGTPSSVPKLARLVLQMATTTIATAAIRPILIKDRLAGGATRPLLRLRESLNQSDRPSNSTTTPAPIQETVGSVSYTHLRAHE